MGPANAHPARRFWGEGNIAVQPAEGGRANAFVSCNLCPEARFMVKDKEKDPGQISSEAMSLEPNWGRYE